MFLILMINDSLTFFSNTAAESISEYALNKWLSGSKRSDLKQKEIEDIIGKATINSKPGKCYSLVFY